MDHLRLVSIRTANGLTRNNTVILMNINDSKRYVDQGRYESQIGENGLDLKTERPGARGLDSPRQNTNLQELALWTAARHTIDLVFGR